MITVTRRRRRDGACRRAPSRGQPGSRGRRLSLPRLRERRRQRSRRRRRSPGTRSCRNGGRRSPPEPECDRVAGPCSGQVGDLPGTVELTAERCVDRAQPRDVVRVEEPASCLAGESLERLRVGPAAPPRSHRPRHWHVVLQRSPDRATPSNRRRDRRSAARGSACPWTSVAGVRRRRRPRRRATYPSRGSGASCPSVRKHVGFRSRSGG